jgi:hypothetical protein
MRAAFGRRWARFASNYSALVAMSGPSAPGVTQDGQWSIVALAGASAMRA